MPGSGLREQPMYCNGPAFGIEEKSSQTRRLGVSVESGFHYELPGLFAT